MNCGTNSLDLEKGGWKTTEGSVRGSIEKTKDKMWDKREGLNY